MSVPGLGIEVKWNGRNRLQVTIPVTMQGSVCGLCGPFNGNPDDDWTVGPATECLLDGAPEPGSQVWYSHIQFKPEYHLQRYPCQLSCYFITIANKWNLYL